MAGLSPYAAAARDALSLAGGGGARARDPEEWARVADVAIRERLGVLAWARGGAAIRASAPAEVVARFRAHAVDQALRQRARLDVLRRVLDALADAGVAAQLHKGMGLAAQLYGDAFVRPSGDVDLVVATGQRSSARGVLEALGWRMIGGGAPFEEVFERAAEGTVELIEVHTLLLGDKHAHLAPLSSPGAPVRLDDVPVTAVDLETAAIALAMNWAGEGMPALLLAFDWHALWGSLDDAARDRVRRIARAHRVERTLAWAVRTSALVGDAVSADDAVAARALARLGVAGERRWVGHPALRAVRHAATPADAVAALRAWVRPPHLAQEGATAALLARRALRGLARLVAGGTTVPRPAAGPPPARDAVRSLATETGELAALVREVAAAGGSLWIRARGDSMRPSIPTGTPVRLGPLPPRALAAGEIVLATLPGGAVVLHRVLQERDGVVRLRGDGNVTPDPPTTRAAVHGRAELVEIAGRRVPVAARPTVAPDVLLRRVRFRIGAALTHARPG